MKYFVIALSIFINYQGYPVPIINDDDEIILFDSKEKAIEMADQQSLCMAGGYEIIEWSHVN